jgi:RHS repeat-associated protein
MHARHYRPESGRFLSRDQYASAAGDQALQADPLTQNRYAFAGGNPVTNVEFDGHRYMGGGGIGGPRTRRGAQYHGPPASTFASYPRLTRRPALRSARSERVARRVIRNYRTLRPAQRRELVAAAARTGMQDCREGLGSGCTQEAAARATTEELFAALSGRPDQAARYAGDQRRIRNWRPPPAGSVIDFAGGWFNEFTFGAVSFGDDKSYRYEGGQFAAMVNPKGIIQAAGKRAVREGIEEVAGSSARRGGDHAADGVRLVGGRRPINSRYAGKTHPSGVRFTREGFPDFSPYAQARAEIAGLTNSYRKDAALANAAVGLRKTPSGMVWHHVEDGRTMLLIPSDIHRATPHTGGAAVIRHGGS